MSNNLDNEGMLVRKEVQTIYNAAKKIEGIQIKMKGEVLEINLKDYTRGQFQSLPHGLSLEKASAIVTPDGVAFQGYGSTASSLYPCEIDDSDCIYNCTEQHLYYKVLECRD